jgi:hypothetical protein
LPSPQASSLLTSGNIRSPWTQLASTAEEFFTLERSLRGIPPEWIDWVEKRAAADARRGVRIRSPLAYRLSNLWRGMIALQECKFLCDLLENSIRQGFASHAAAHQIRWADLCWSIPQLKQWPIIDSREAAGNPLLNSSLLTRFTFYQLTETMLRNWKEVKAAPSGVLPGFRLLFWTSSRCRNEANFRDDLKRVRGVRNDIAHLKRLLLPTESQAIYDISRCWLSTLEIDVNERIRLYRFKRPRFLQEVRVGC